MRRRNSSWSGTWGPIAILLAVTALIPLIHVHPLGDHDRSLADPSQSVCGLCVSGTTIDDPVTPDVLSAPQVSGTAWADESLLPAGLVSGASSSRAPPAA